MKYALGVGGVVIVALLLILPLPTTVLTLPPPAEPEPKAVLLFGGDIMFDRYIRSVSDTVGGDYIFSCIVPLLLEVDGVVANLEGPITDFASVSVGAPEEAPEHFTFTFPPETALLLARHNFLAVNVGNNHIANFSREGVKQTKTYLDEAGVSYFGLPLFSNSQEFENSGGGVVTREEVNGIPFSFISYNEFNPFSVGKNVESKNRIIYDTIFAEKELGNAVVVYTHWGDEYVAPPERVKVLARQFVDAGASLVVGSHPHVVQESERYKDASIYYSLGNFVFDQYFSDEVKNGLLLEVTFDPSGVESIKEVPIVLHPDGRTCFRDHD